jgi:hypothetical protein
LASTFQQVRLWAQESTVSGKPPLNLPPRRTGRNQLFAFFKASAGNAWGVFFQKFPALKVGQVSARRLQGSNGWAQLRAVDRQEKLEHQYRF